MGEPLSPAEQALRDAALEYHRSPTRGKISVTPTKPLSNQRDLSLAYSPGVAYPCLAIEDDPALAAEYTSRGNLVGVVTNGTAVLGLGDIGPLAAQAGDGRQGLPVQEVRRHRRVRHRARRDATPTSWSTSSPRSSRRSGGINLEDIKAPECFYIERKLRERHERSRCSTTTSTAPRSSPARRCSTGSSWSARTIGAIKLVSSGAGAAAIACLDMMVGLGVKRENIFVVDSQGRDPARARGRAHRQARREQAALLPEDARRARWPTW